MPRESVPIRVARMLERRTPRIANFVAVPRVTGAVRSSLSGGHAEVWNPAAVVESRAVGESTVIVVAEHPVSARWLGGSLSSRLGAQVIVARGRDAMGTRSADAIVGLGAAATAAIDLCRRMKVERLALVSPVGLPASVPSGLPTTLIQTAAGGANRAMVSVFERTLRATGTAVRDTDYPTIPDEWVTLPRLIRGSSAALDDLIAFLERGIGAQSTFEVIPGWDLH